MRAPPMSGGRRKHAVGEPALVPLHEQLDLRAVRGEVVVLSPKRENSLLGQGRWRLGLARSPAGAPRREVEGVLSDSKGRHASWHRRSTELVLLSNDQHQGLKARASCQ